MVAVINHTACIDPAFHPFLLVVATKRGEFFSQRRTYRFEDYVHQGLLRHGDGQRGGNGRQRGRAGGNVGGWAATPSRWTEKTVVRIIIIA